MGWCADYPDERNWVHELFHSTEGINRIRWSNPTFDTLVEQAAASTDPATRKQLYKQAEEILCAEQAGIASLYYYTSVTLTKPYLERTYAPLGAQHVDKWRMTNVQVDLPPSGGQVGSIDGETTLTFGAGAFADSVVLTYTPCTPYPPGTPAGAPADRAYADIGRCFEVEATYSSNGQPAQLVSGQTYTVTLHYTELETKEANPDTLALYHWAGSQWARESSSAVDTARNLVMATPGQLGTWTVLGEKVYYLYLPTVVRAN
jgi:hypothetical protein